MSGCETCDFIGPELPTLTRDARELHRATHDLGRALAHQALRLLRSIGLGGAGS